MIATGDPTARNAFCVGLREEPSRPNITQELDASDILEVQDVAEAIARAEELVRTRSAAVSSSSTSSMSSSATPLDVFDALVRGSGAGEAPTDDASGPALHAPVTKTPLPLPLPDAARAMLVLPPIERALVLTKGPPQASSASSASSADDSDAYLVPGGRIRTLGEVTVEGYQPEPTMLLRIRKRRGTLSFVVLALTLGLTVLAGAGIWFGASDASVSLAAAPRHITYAPVRVTPREPSRAPETARDTTPTFDVKSLPTAR